jgi:putative polyhydroxyalkanoate system protein
MATIEISRSHQLGLDVAKQRAEQLAKDLEGKLGIKWSWEGDDIRFKAESGAAKGARGAVIVKASQVRVEVDLPLLLRAMKGTIAGKVEEKLDKVLA